MVCVCVLCFANFAVTIFISKRLNTHQCTSKSVKNAADVYRKNWKTLCVCAALLNCINLFKWINWILRIQSVWFGKCLVMRSTVTIFWRHKIEAAKHSRNYRNKLMQVNRHELCTSPFSRLQGIATVLSVWTGLYWQQLLRNQLKKYIQCI